MQSKGQYEIITNVKGRRILVINRLTEIDRILDLRREDFDAMFINIALRAYAENRLIMRWASPLRSRKCFLKPLFATTSLKEYMSHAVYLIDGFCTSPLDTEFTDYIEWVYGNISKYAFATERYTEMNSTVRVLNIMMKYDISRGRLTYTDTTIRGLASGYSAAFLAWYDQQETLQAEERTKFNLKMVELGFAQPTRFIERVHVCPECRGSHLLFMESCPSCHSSNISEQSVIHHFRCANISPESTYQWDGQLRCPKCKKLLMHIGVDYDRPATVQTCNDCGHTFLNSHMKVVCAICGKHTTPEELMPQDIHEYRLTEDGIRAFASGDALIQIESKDIFSGHCTYEEFIQTISSFSEMQSYRGHQLLIIRYQYSFGGADASWRLLDILRSVISSQNLFKVTTHKDEMLFLHVVQRQKMEEEAPRLRKLIRQLFVDYTNHDEQFSYRPLREYVFSYGDVNVEEFIQHLDDHIGVDENPDGKGAY